MDQFNLMLPRLTPVRRELLFDRTRPNVRFGPR
jgi:hypothetical protein